MKQLWFQLNNYYKNSHGIEKNIIEYILKNPDEVVNLNIRQLANKTYTSTSAIVRFMPKLGLQGYKEFKNIWISEFGIENHKKKEDVSKDDDLDDIVNKLGLS